MASTEVHNWLAIVTLGLHLYIVARLLYLEQSRMWFGPSDAALIVVAEISLALLMISGLYLSGPLGMTTRVMHRLAAFAAVATNVAFLLLINYSATLRKGRRPVSYTLVLFSVNSILIFLAYWVSSGAAMGWWLYPETWSNEMGR